MPIQGLKVEVKMEIRVKSLKFDATQKLQDYVDKKVSRLSKFDDTLKEIEVTLSLLTEPENKNVKLQTRLYGQDLLIERKAASFEDAVSAAVDAMKEKIVRTKEKKFEA
jgi:putative sigma-54 modulation protein